MHSDKPVVVQSVLEASRRLHEAKLNNEYASVDRDDTISDQLVLKTELSGTQVATQRQSV